MQIVRESFAPGLTHAHGDRRVALVPTMGALHDGHLALVARAKELADRVVVSIFVNPLQFNDGGDLDRYPRQEESDLAKLEAAGCDLAWLPSVADLYPDGFATTIRVARLGERWEGEHRPGHFDGVATIVAKLFAAVRPQVAVFGEKDFQQLAIIRRMAADLDLCRSVVGVPTVREADGLAMSSRNLLLDPDERSRAAALPRALEEARRAIGGGEAVHAALETARATLAEAGFSPIDYLALVDAYSLEPVDSVAGAMRLIAAATIGSTRLIDNLAVEVRQ